MGSLRTLLGLDNNTINKTAVGLHPVVTSNIASQSTAQVLPTTFSTTVPTATTTTTTLAPSTLKNVVSTLAHTTTRLPSKTLDEANNASHIMAYVFVPLGALVLIAVLSFLVVFILKKSRLDKLRHHLMPLYNFDPAEEGEDWESELLEEDKEQQVALHIRSPSPTRSPKLRFSTGSMDV